jgi:hypothetical protein
VTTPLELSATDSNLTIQTYATDRAQAKTAWLSGGLPLRNISWEAVDTSAGANIWAADLSSVHDLGDVKSLRIGGERGILARYPNCNPETTLCLDPHTAATSTKATSWATSTGKSNQAYAAPPSTDRRVGNSTIHGNDIGYTMNYGGEACDVLTPSISHFCSGNRKVVGATVSKANAPHQPYANPEGARFTAMHGGSWCSFAYEVGGYSFDTSTGAGHFVFSAGGQQCNQQESSHGPLIIEGVYEELDTAGEFFFNVTTKMLTLWYNATSGTPPPADGSIVVPTLTTVIAARGSQAAAVKNLDINGIGIRDTAPSIMLPHTGPR